MSEHHLDDNGLRALLRWYVDMGVDVAIDAEPTNQFAVADQPDIVRDEEPITGKKTRKKVKSAPITQIAPSTAPTADEAVLAAEETSKKCQTVEELQEAVVAFDGCTLKAGARNTVFVDGFVQSDLLVIGEAPGREEDRLGKPFVGKAGQLLDQMLASIGRSRAENVIISNVIFWRPPGNRTPTAVEVAVCKPFVDRLVELVAPKAILLAGGAPTLAMLGISGIMRARGTWKELETSSGKTIPVLPSLHPAFLLRQPAAKRLAWQDLLALEARLRDG